jgi:hypothetical protein
MSNEQQNSIRPLLKELLLTDAARADIPVVVRGNRRRRATIAFDD